MQSNNETLPDLDISLYVWINEIDLHEMEISADIQMRVENYPVDADYIVIGINDKDNTQIKCNKLDLFEYLGESYSKTWKIYGLGDMYPFDFYSIDIKPMMHLSYFNVNNSDLHSFEKGNNTYRPYLLNYTIKMGSWGRFNSEKEIEFSDIWKTEINYFLPSEIKKESLNIFIERVPTVPLFQFLLPLYISEIFMLFTIILCDGTEPFLVSIYSIFIAFSPFNTLAIQNFLPTRRVLSIPEFYSIFIFITSIILLFKYIIFYTAFKDINNLYHKSLKSIINFVVIFSILFTHNTIFMYLYGNIKDEIITTIASTFLVSLTDIINIFLIVETLLIFYNLYLLYRDNKEQIDARIDNLRTRVVAILARARELRAHPHKFPER